MFFVIAYFPEKSDKGEEKKKQNIENAVCDMIRQRRGKM